MRKVMSEKVGKVEKNIPIPEGVVYHKTKYPWPELSKGDSFAVETSRKPKAALSRIIGSGRGWAKRQGKKDWELHGEVTGTKSVRIWRIR